MENAPFHIIWYAPWLTKLLSIVVPIHSMTIGPLIITQDPDLKNNVRALQHELIHVKQFYELFFIGLPPVYGWDFLHGLYLYGDKRKAYFKIRFEQEAYDHAGTDNYLTIREPFAWKEYAVED